MQALLYPVSAAVVVAALIVLPCQGMMGLTVKVSHAGLDFCQNIALNSGRCLPFLSEYLLPNLVSGIWQVFDVIALVHLLVLRVARFDNQTLAGNQQLHNILRLVAACACTTSFLTSQGL